VHVGLARLEQAEVQLTPGIRRDCVRDLPGVPPAHSRPDRNLQGVRVEEKVFDRHLGRARSKRVGRVLSQSPRPGTARRGGFSVRLVVGRR